MMNCEDVNLSGPYDSIHDPIRVQQHFADFWVVELGDSPTRMGKLVEAVNRAEEAPQRDDRVVPRVGFDERVNRGQVTLGTLRPEDGHARNRFLTPS
jgi:hypothetical protein